jgi:hypothetical protein
MNPFYNHTHNHHLSAVAQHLQTNSPPLSLSPSFNQQIQQQQIQQQHLQHLQNVQQHNFLQPQSQSLSNGVNQTTAAVTAASFYARTTNDNFNTKRFIQNQNSNISASPQNPSTV